MLPRAAIFVFHNQQARLCRHVRQRVEDGGSRYKQRHRKRKRFISLDLEIDSDGAIRPFMFEPQHGTSSQEEAEEEDSSNQQEAVESDSDGVVRSRPGDRDWCACTNC